jgi:DNA-3-methyladenine glycosylase II
MTRTLDSESFLHCCDLLGQQDKALKNIVDQYGYPPFWSRTPSFETIVHIILEQQVSLASAKAALAKLQEKLGDITPAKFITLTDSELKSCYFSRQKIGYARHLAEAVLSEHLRLEKLADLDDEAAKSTLLKLPGIGQWTADIYLMMALHRSDCFPLGDIALVNSLKQVKKLPPETPREVLGKLVDNWKPMRTAAAYLLWHAYLSRRRHEAGGIT